MGKEKYIVNCLHNLQEIYICKIQNLQIITEVLYANSKLLT